MFAARLDEIMKRRGLTDRNVRDKLAELDVKVSHVYVVQMRQGKATNPTIGVVKALAEVLNVRTSWLLGESDPSSDAPFAGLSNASREAMRVMLELARRADRLAPIGWDIPPPPQLGERADAKLSAVHPYLPEEVERALSPDADHIPPNRVGARLRELRLKAELSTAEADLVVGTEAGWVDGVEAGSTTPSTRMLQQLLSRYGVMDPFQQQLFAAAARGDLDDRWWFPYFQRLPMWLVVFMEMEDSSELIRTFSSDSVPPLLQHPEYAVAVRQAAHHPETAADQVEFGVKILRDRQRRLLEERTTKIWAVIQESVLLDDLGGTDVQVAQLDLLIELAQRPEITIQINPGGPGRYRPRGGPFTLMRLPGDGRPDVVWLPHLVEDLLLSDMPLVKAYHMAHTRLSMSAGDPDRSGNGLARIRERVVREALTGRG
ncbi:Scr1 family TA system antitoxin-like transcriptional regulator [Nonomuraea sp. NPDC026600]|uniref:Scr1 family TA system antitoxin-like transcriptional regulator n=1 Tax=Nonomuraea sp. NPDC026600 TaxID=3155363 RepID=UPI0033EC72E7